MSHRGSQVSPRVLPSWCPTRLTSALHHVNRQDGTALSPLADSPLARLFAQVDGPTMPWPRQYPWPIMGETSQPFQQHIAALGTLARGFIFVHHFPLIHCLALSLHSGDIIDFQHSGHSLGTGLSDFPIATMTPPCYRRVDAGEVSIMGALSHGTGSTRLFTEGIQAHQAWHISWDASDTSTLTPSLPELTSQKLIPTWVPGETIEKGMYDRDHGDDEAVPGLNKLLRDLAIALPLVFVTLVGLNVWCCISNRRSKRGYRVKPQVMSSHELTAVTKE